MTFPRRCGKQLVSQQKGRWGHVKEGLFQRRTGAGGVGFADGGAANAVPAGPKGTTLQDILQAVGISKPYTSFFGYGHTQPPVPFLCDDPRGGNVGSISI